MKKTSIAFFMQHYLTPSMTFIYRQINLIKNRCESLVLVSNKLENIDLFPFHNIALKERNFNSLKTSRIFTHFYSIDNLLSINPKLSSRQKKYFESIIKKNNVQVIHAHFGPSGIEILPVARKLKIPLVVSFHGYDASFLLESETYKFGLRELFKYSTVIAPTDFMVNKLSLLGLNFDNSYVIHYGVMLNDFEFKSDVSIKLKFIRNDNVNLSTNL